MIALLVAAGLIAGGSPLPRACDAGLLQTSGDPALLMRPQDWASARARKLGDLPEPRREYAVLRRIDGCMVPVLFGRQPPP